MKSYPTINRNLILVIPQQPFYDWSNALFPGLAPTQMVKIYEHNSYLIDDELLLGDIKNELKPYWKAIFENELFGQNTNPDTWPAMTWKRFNEWFKLKQSSIITDLNNEPLYQQSYE